MESIDFTDFENDLQQAKIGSMEAKERVVNRYMPYIYKKSFNYNLSSMEFEDLVSVGTMTVLECIKKYDKGKNSNFTSYVIRAINNNILYVQRNEQRKTYLNTSMNEAAISIEDLNENTANNLIISYEKQCLKDALSLLNPAEKELINSIYFKRESLKVISKRLNVTYQTVINRRDKILKKLLSTL